jgi:hypothetical protein
VLLPEQLSARLPATVALVLAASLLLLLLLLHVPEMWSRLLAVCMVAKRMMFLPTAMFCTGSSSKTMYILSMHSRHQG